MTKEDVLVVEMLVASFDGKKCCEDGVKLNVAGWRWRRRVVDLKAEGNIVLIAVSDWKVEGVWPPDDVNVLPLRGR